MPEFSKFFCLMKGTGPSTDQMGLFIIDKGMYTSAGIDVYDLG
ncbi:MAG: hypothetical protein QXV22_04295 [Thermoplasmataceae archaeon]